MEMHVNLLLDGCLSRSQEDGETMMKTTNDFWVIGKRSDQREFYVILHQKNANLIEISGMHSYSYDLIRF